jgi:hypothetical protein
VKLTKAQLEFIDERRATNRETLKYKPEEGWFWLKLELKILNLFIELHNVALREEKEQQK